MSLTPLCPACAAPVSASSLSCAFCDFVIRVGAPFAALPAAASRRLGPDTPVVSTLQRVVVCGLKRLAKVAVVLAILTGAALAGSLLGMMR